MQPITRSEWGRLALAALVPCVACAVQWLLWDEFQPLVWFLLYPAVFLSARLDGLRGALIATPLAALLGLYFFIPPQLSFAVTNPRSLFSVGIFCLMGVLFGLTHESLRRTQARLRELYEKARELDEIKSQFFANVSHELRTPLTLIMGPVARLLAQPNLAAETLRELEVTERNAQLLYRHVNDLLEVAKVEAGRATLCASRLDLASLARMVASHFELLAVERGMRLEVQSPAELPAEADAEKCQRILLNLLANAFKFTPAGGTVALTLQAEGTHAVVTVEDSGPGIPADLREAVFERFRQVEGGASRQHGGTGLGLAIAREFALLHGGTLFAGQSRLGGAVFVLKLPLTAPAGTAQASEPTVLDPLIEKQTLYELAPPQAAAPGALGSDAPEPLVLVVEDNADMRAFLAQTLGRHYRVLTAVDGRQGLDVALSAAPDLILSDVMMPGMSGIELAQALREHEATRQTPILILTAKADDALRVTMLRGLVQDYLNKPFTEPELLARAERLVAERRRQASELAASEKRFEELFNLLPTPVRLIDLESLRFSLFNTEAARMLGYTFEEFAALRVTDVDAQQDEDTLRRNGALVTQGETICMESSHRTKQGDLRDVMLYTTGVEYAGRPHALTLVIDLTERKRDTQLLELNRRHLSHALRLARIGHWEYDVARDRFTFNDEFYAMMRTHVDREGGYEKAPEDFANRFLPPEVRQVVRREIETALAAHTGDYSRQFDHRAIFADGSEGDLAVRFDAIQDAAGHTNKLVGTNQDVTERKHIERQLQEQEARYRRLVEGLPGIVYIYSVQRGGIYYSPHTAQILGYTPEQLYAQPQRWRDSIHPDDRVRVAEAIVNLQRQLSYSVEYRVADAHGEWHWLLDLSLGWHTEHGDLLVEGLALDITERKRTESEREQLQGQLQQAQKMESIGRLAGGVAHDFNNMLTVILGRAELALEGMTPRLPQYEDLVEIKLAAERSADLTRQLLAFARKQTVEPRLVDLNQIVGGTLKMLQRLIGESIELIWQPEKDVWPVKVDPAQVDQILANLCVNARDAIDGTGRIVIATANRVLPAAGGTEPPDLAPGNYVELTVSDNGPGISPEIRTQVFEPFFTTKRPGKGTGLGLATVYGAVRQNNGGIVLDSTTGRGTCFRIYLPRHADNGHATTTASEAAGQALDGGAETVLLVEDEAGILNMVGTMLGQLGYRVLPALGPEKALEVAEAHAGRIDLLLTDVIMPDMTGLELAQRLQQAHTHLRVLYFSGYTADVIANQGLLADGVQFVQKPFSRAVLAHKIRKVLNAPQTP